MDNISQYWNKANKKFLSTISLSVSGGQIILILITVVILVIRISAINSPSLKWTAWKEIDYLYISQSYLNQGFNFLRPEVGWPAEPPRVTEMELPLVPFLAALLYKVVGYNVYSARLITLIAFLLIIIYTYKLVKRELGEFPAITAALAAGIIPLYNPFNRFLFTEPLMIASSVASLYYLAEWVDNQRRSEWLQAFIMLTLAFSLKIETLYLLLPIFWIAFRKYNFQISRYKDFVLLISLTFIIPLIWYSYAYYLEMTGAHLFGIFRGHDKSQTISMLTDLRWYRTMAGRIINGIAGGIIGSCLFIIGFLSSTWFRKGGLFFAYLAAIIAYFALVAEGQIDAPYRQMTIIPAMSVYIALGTQFIAVSLLAPLDIPQNLGTGLSQQRMYLLLSCMLIISLVPIQKYKSIIAEDGPVHWDRWLIAEEINKIADDESKLVVLGEYSKHVGGYDLGPVLYFYTNLQGWTLTPKDWNLDYIDSLRQKGAHLLVVLLPYGYPYEFIYLPESSPQEFIESMKAKYPIMYENQDQLILNLRGQLP